MAVALTIGSNLTPARDGVNEKLSNALSDFIERLQLIFSTRKTLLYSKGNMRVFTKAGAPATNTEADSPGQDMCFVIDTTNEDLYFISAWASATSFTATKILD